jgi:hypothetical protein
MERKGRKIVGGEKEKWGKRGQIDIWTKRKREIGSNVL